MASFFFMKTIHSLLILSFILLFISSAESSMHKGGCKIKCVRAVAVEAGDTCFSIARSNAKSLNLFKALNPNLPCKRLFVGEWVCGQGTAC